MADAPLPHLYRHSLTRAAQCLADMLKAEGNPIIGNRDLFLVIRKMYREKRSGLYLRAREPGINEYGRLVRQLSERHVLIRDADYRRQAWRVVPVGDRPANDIVCILDRFCHISHLSAMQRWGLTDRIPETLMLTRPDRTTVRQLLKAAEKGERTPFPAVNVGHPALVRNRPVKVREARHAGANVRNPAGFERISTIGQTFLDMLDQPALCGGMAHVLAVWREHAADWSDAIVEAVDGSPTAIVRCRAGYILEELLGIVDVRIDNWKTAAQRGGSRKLDPAMPFSPQFSEVWMLSLNAQ